MKRGHLQLVDSGVGWSTASCSSPTSSDESLGIGMGSLPSSFVTIHSKRLCSKYSIWWISCKISRNRSGRGRKKGKAVDEVGRVDSSAMGVFLSEGVMFVDHSKSPLGMNLLPLEIQNIMSIGRLSTPAAFAKRITINENGMLIFFFSTNFQIDLRSKFNMAICFPCIIAQSSKEVLNLTWVVWVLGMM
ncbi:uncharacterized protein DS421_12g368110 [Arachis hypogaea]|nr:uncharacterized protein DS421_12g368110 [Arachis hypogaea]